MAWQGVVPACACMTKRLGVLFCSAYMTVVPLAQQPLQHAVSCAECGLRPRFACVTTPTKLTLV